MRSRTYLPFRMSVLCSRTGVCGCNVLPCKARDFKSSWKPSEATADLPGEPLSDEPRFNAGCWAEAGGSIENIHNGRVTKSNNAFVQIQFLMSFSQVRK